MMDEQERKEWAFREREIELYVPFTVVCSLQYVLFIQFKYVN